MRLLLAVTVLALAPLGALAQERCNKSEQHAMSCAEGTVWDENTQSCIVTTS